VNATALTIYKIFRAQEWTAFERSKIFAGSPDDVKDGFIHFSSGEQLRETAAKHFAAEADIMVAAVDAAVLGDDLKWEPSRGGKLFPHLYAPLEMSSVRSAVRVVRDATGRYALPPEIP